MQKRCHRFSSFRCTRAARVISPPAGCDSYCLRRSISAISTGRLLRAAYAARKQRPRPPPLPPFLLRTPFSRLPAPSPGTLRQRSIFPRSADDTPPGASAHRYMRPRSGALQSATLTRPLFIFAHASAPLRSLSSAIAFCNARNRDAASRHALSYSADAKPLHTPCD